jgi:hypothetical protein
MRLNSEFWGWVIVGLCRLLPLFLVIGQWKQAHALLREVASVPVVWTF